MGAPALLQTVIDRELTLFGLRGPDISDDNRVIGQQVTQILDLLTQDHTEGSLQEVVAIVYDLVNGIPLTPLTGDDSEWIPVTNRIHQNIRYASVFKDLETGEAYDVHGETVVSADGESMSYGQRTISFPYDPTAISFSLSPVDEAEGFAFQDEEVGA